MVDHPRSVVHGLSILAKLHVDRTTTFGDIAIGGFWRFGLKLPIHAHFGGVWGVFPQMTSLP